MNYHQNVPAAERTLKILELLAADPEGASAGDIVAALEIPRSAVFALLNTLKDLGYVIQTEARQPYRLGPRAQALAQPRAPGGDALIRAFYDETAHHPPAETLALAVLRGGDVLTVAEAATDQTVRSVAPVGHRAPALHHPAGRVLLAALPATALQRACPEAPVELPAQLEGVRRQTADIRVTPDVADLAVPICPDGHRPAAALWMSAPAFRWRALDEAARQRALRALRETAARISYRLGAQRYLPYGTGQGRRLGPSVPMAKEELHDFLGGPWAARLACVRPDGSPHVVPVWYEWRDAAFWIAAWPGSVWAHFVSQNPAVALTIDEPWPPLRRLLVRGQAQALDPARVPGGIEALYRRLSARYLGNPAQPGALDPFSGQGWQAFKIPPTSIVARREA